MSRLFVLLLLLLSLPAFGAQVSVECVGVSTDAGTTRLTLDLSAAVSHRIFTLDEPDRVVIDIAEARLSGKLPAATAKDPTLIGLRSGVRNDGDLRIVMDLKRPVRVKSFPAGGRDARSHRLVIELFPRGGSEPLREARMLKVSQESLTGGRTATTGRTRTAVVAIDAGHGGEDPGAIGPRGTHEKDVTLAIARKLAKLVDREPGMRAVMIRDGDRYIALRQRILEARRQNADLFISIHADAFKNPDANGSSVYTLSQGGASSEAANWLADRENSADLIGGVDLSNSDELLATVLLDMTQNATLEHSAEAAGAVLTSLKRVGSVHKSDVQRAGFVVLKSPDIPSMLVETAFISNTGEEQRLRTNAHQQRLAQAILAGVRAYFRKYPPRTLTTLTAGPGLRTAEVSAGARRGSLEYVISQGDTLSGIAQKYRVSLSSLRAENGLNENDLIRVGQVLSIPTGS